MWPLLLLFLFPVVNSGIKVKLGHIGAQGTMINSEKILELSRQELIRDGILGDDFDVEIISAMGCGDSFEGVAVGADMYHVQKIRAFIGPYCNAELDAVSKMGSFWNVAVVGYMSSSTIFADKSVYKTLARISLRTTNSLAEAVAALLKHYSWNRVGVATSTGALAYERMTSFEEVFHKRGIAVARKVLFDESADAAAMASSGLLQELSNSARIIICVFSSTREMSKEFMKAVHLAEMASTDFVYILPWLQTEKKDLSPWVEEDGQIQQKVKDTFANTWIIDDVNGFDNTLVTPFQERIEAAGMTTDNLEMRNIYGYIHLYDALRLYCIAVRKLINETGNYDAYLDGRAVWNAMRRLTFPGLASAAGVTSGTVVMDDIAERAPIYAAFYVSPNSENVKKINEMEPKMISNCDGLKTKSGCYDLMITDVITGFWPSPDGSLPKDEPACGYRNEKCDYTLLILGGSLLVVFLLGMGAALIVFRVCQSRHLAKMPWRIYREDFRIINEEEAKSMLSIGSSKTKMSNLSTFVKHHAVLGTNTHCSFHLYPQRKPISFNRQDMQLLTQMKQVVHDNLNPFLGMSFNEKEEMVLLWKFCSRGTLQDIIYNDNIALDAKFHAAFIRDITLGLEYLHSSPIGYHGSLTPWACLIDRQWTVKLTDYGIQNALEKWEKQGSVCTETLKEGDEKSASTQKTSTIYLPPEFLKNREANRLRRTDQKWVKQSATRRQMADVYAFGMLMYEILFRSLPFPQGTNLDELMDYIKDGNKVYKPSIQGDKKNIHPDLVSLLLDCWNENPEVRPSIRRVRLSTENYLKVKGSLVDQMMRMMEQYANNLEKLVTERTGMLEEANVRADKLLSQLLPKYVANELKMGRAVPPKTFKSASVMFSDIVGFTTICSGSTPLEVVNMLNAIYSKFDDVIVKNHSYKVETIGDAYMIVAGIPEEEQGARHVMKISDTALDLMKLLTTFQIPHRKADILRIRLGIHTGPVAAGVVGLSAPRYCLFGDTVNVASRMESSGKPEMIQISDVTNGLLNKFFPEFITSVRGPVEIKGIGAMTTYWLDGKKNIHLQSEIDEENRKMALSQLGF